MAEMFRPVPTEQEPKRKNRFVLEFPTELGIDSFNVQTSGKPSITINSTEIPYMNSYTYVAGKYKWEPIDISFIDVIGPSTTQKVMEWVRLHAESATGRMGYALGYKKNLVLKALDPAGAEVEKLTLIGSFITSAKFDDFDYGTDDISKVEITVQPDRCLHNG
jgi:hypothetical protein